MIDEMVVMGEYGVEKEKLHHGEIVTPDLKQPIWPETFIHVKIIHLMDNFWKRFCEVDSKFSKIKN